MHEISSLTRRLLHATAAAVVLGCTAMASGGESMVFKFSTMELRPDICSLDIGALNFGTTVFVNTGAHVERMAERIRATGSKPELEVFDLGHLRQAVHLIEAGHFDAPPLLQICLGIPWGAPATPEALQAMIRHLPSGANCSAFGISQQQRPIAALAILLGGHVRVGLEDNLYLDKGVLAPGNAALVEQAVKIVEALGERVASPERVHEIFGLRHADAGSGVS